MGIVDDARGEFEREERVRREQAALAAQSKQPLRFYYVLTAEAAAAVKEVVREYKRLGIPTVSMVAVTVEREEFPNRWIRPKVVRTITRTLIGQGWPLSSSGSDYGFVSSCYIGMTTDGRLVRFRGDELTRKPGSDREAGAVTLYRGFRPRKTSFVEVSALGPDPVGLDTELVISSIWNSFGSDPASQIRSPLREILHDAVKMAYRKAIS